MSILLPDLFLICEKYYTLSSLISPVGPADKILDRELSDQSKFASVFY